MTSDITFSSVYKQIEDLLEDLGCSPEDINREGGLNVEQQPG